jgi:hypothetical protein
MHLRPVKTTYANLANRKFASNITISKSDVIPGCSARAKYGADRRR